MPTMDFLNKKPWRTFQNANRLVLKPGDQVLLKRGDIWNHRLEIRGSGSPDAWILVGAYGNSKLPKPSISLTNHRDDIGVLFEDTLSISRPSDSSSFALNYIHLDQIDIRNSRLGIYVRLLTFAPNVGLKITGCDFTNINCDEVLQNVTVTDEAERDNKISQELAMPKGRLASFDNNSPSGEYEYIFPAAIFIGGKCVPVTNNNPAIKPRLSELVVDSCVFDDVTTGVMSVFYWPNVGDCTTANDCDPKDGTNKKSIFGCGFVGSNTSDQLA